MRRRIPTSVLFSKRPKVKQYIDDDLIIISTKVLTAPRLFTLTKTVFTPMELLWKFTSTLLVVELLLFLGRRGDVFSYLPCSRIQCYLVILMLSLFWFWEKTGGYKFIRLLLGKRFRVRIDHDKIQIGGWLFQKTYARDQRLMFSTEKFMKAHSDTYQGSLRICLIIGDARRLEMLEVYGLLESSWLVNNLNTALRMTDPDNRRPDIAQPHRQR